MKTVPPQAPISDGCIQATAPIAMTKAEMAPTSGVIAGGRIW